MHESDRKILAVLNEDGGFTTGEVSKAAFPHANSRRQQSGAVRSWLNVLWNQGLICPMDDLKPICWIRTKAGTEALAPPAA